MAEEVGGGGRDGGSRGGVAWGAFHAETPAGPTTSDAVVPRGREVSQPNEHSFLLGEGGGRRGVHAGYKCGGRAVDDAVVDPNVMGVIHGQGRVHRRELVEGWHVEVRHVAGRGAMGQVGTGRAVEDRGIAYRGRLRGATTTTTTTTITTTTKTSKNRASISKCEPHDNKHRHGGISNQFIEFGEPPDALKYIIAGA